MVLRLVIAEQRLVLSNLNRTLIFIAKTFLRLFFIDFLHPLNLKAPRMFLSNANVFKVILIPQWTYFLLVKGIRPFLHEKVVIMQSDGCRWFYTPIYGKWLPLTSQGDSYTLGCLLDYECIETQYKLIAIDLSRQKELISDPKANQQKNLLDN